jgi:hypothetical protein
MVMRTDRRCTARRVCKTVLQARQFSRVNYWNPAVKRSIVNEVSDGLPPIFRSLTVTLPVAYRSNEVPPAVGKVSDSCRVVPQFAYAAA